ncbi:MULTISPECIES: type II secretion system protein GspK [unclassified Acidovorax]|uniref:type II secretion system protein GspK n=2 Tax=unclassified Acidovorax TaxID=2684926 RepID=UPI002882FE82|nr:MULTISPECIES: type II secretion system protein GspK [unclassified Acidovorax]
MMSLSRQSVQAQALGDGAIQIALQALSANNQPLTQWVQSQVVYRGVSMQVQVTPLSGYIDINAAPPSLLERLFSVAGGLAPAAAQTAAQAVIAVRDTPDARGARQRFEAEEDLLRVPGIDYDLYARLADLLTADVRGSGRVNPLAAPVEVLMVLTGGNAGAAMQIASRRAAGQVGVDTSSIDGSLTEISAVRQFRIQARVPMADGSVMRIARNVALDARMPDGAPWHTFRTFRSVEPVQRANTQ